MEHKIQKITIYSAGLIGAGWATHLLLKGIEDLTLYDLNDAALQRGLQILNRNMDFLIEAGILTAEQKTGYLAKLNTTTDPAAAVKDADLIIENGPEILEVKQSILEVIESACRDDAIITSSTSGIAIGQIVSKAKHPERIFGAHPYHPVYLIPLLEIVVSSKTQEKYLNPAMELFRAVSKKPVILKKESDGYIGSHLMLALLRESASLILNGVCTMQDIDDAFTYGPGLRYALMGIFTTYQLAGGDDGIHGLLCGPIGQSTDQWLSSYCNWSHWPSEAKELFEHSQEQMDVMLQQRDALHGHNNRELENFRDKGLVKLLQVHGML